MSDTMGKILKTGSDRIKGSIFIVSAPSGAGKTTLCKELCKAVTGLRHAVSYTTRTRRKGERDKLHYFFVGPEIFKKMIKGKEFAEWATVHGNLYGTSRRHIEEIINKGYDIILDIDVNGATQMRREYKGAYYIFILPPSMKTLKKRLSFRKSDSDSEIVRRLENAKDEIASYNKYDYIVVNNKFEKALEELKSIIITDRLKTKRLKSSIIESLC